MRCDSYAMKVNSKEKSTIPHRKPPVQARDAFAIRLAIDCNVTANEEVRAALSASARPP